jgi:hypothetical protein
MSTNNIIEDICRNYPLSKCTNLDIIYIYIYIYIIIIINIKLVSKKVGFALTKPKLLLLS